MMLDEAPPRTDEVRSWRRRSGGKDAARLVWIVTFAAFFLLGAAWSLAMPYDGPPDELQHVTRAYGVATGQIYVGKANAKVKTAKSLVPKGNGCFRWNAATTANCQQTPGANAKAMHSWQKVISGASGYDPSYYLFVGPVLRLSPDMTGIVLARLFTDAEIAAFLACAMAIGWTSSRGRWMVAGIAVGITPVAVNLMGAVNPAGVEIGAAVAFWACLLDLLGPGAARRWVLWVAVWSGAVFALTRGFGVGWLGATAVICAVGADREKLLALWRLKAVRWAGVGIVAACALAGLWDLAAGANYDLTGATPPHTSLRQVSLQEIWVRLPFYLDGTVRQTSYGDVPVPQVVSQIWFFFVGLLVLGGLWVGSVRIRIQILAIIAISFAMLMVTDINAVRQGFWFSQGRYALPLLVGAPMIGALALGRSRLFEGARGLSILRWMAVFLLPLQLVALWTTMLRFQHGYPANGNLPMDAFSGAWLPPLGPELPVALMCLGLAVLGWCAWRAEAFAKRLDALASTTATVPAPMTGTA
jgi:hypothetical protein